MIASISYTVPVQVWVDLDTGKVHRVVTIDEGIEPDRASGFLADAGTMQPLTDGQVDAAYAAAEAADEWPAWEAGF